MVATRPAAAPVDDTIILSDPAAARAAIDGFRAGAQPLTGLELYYELERSTSLLLSMSDP